MANAARSHSPPPASANLGLWRVASRGVQHFRGMLWPVALGVAAATAVIVGALLVGDSVRGSLHFLALDRLGKIEQVLLAPKFFDQSTLEKWSTEATFPGQAIGKPLPVAIFQQARIERSKSGTKDGQVVKRSGNTLVMGITKEFWQLGDSLSEIEIGHNEIVLNEALAQEIGVDVGDKVTVRLPSQSAVPADSPLGRRDTETVNLPGLKVIQIVPNKSIGRFDLRSNQRPSKNAFVRLRSIQDALDRDGEVNGAILPQALKSDREATAKSRVAVRSNAVPVDLLESLPLTLYDMGYAVKRIERHFPDAKRGEGKPESVNAATKVLDYFQITSNQLLLPDKAVAEIQKRWPDEAVSPVLTYLANGIQKVSNEPDTLSIPYSTISAIDPATLKSKSVGFADSSTIDLDRFEGDDVLINSWLAEQLNVKVGDRLRVDYFLPETIDGHEVEKTFSATLVAVVPLTEPELGYSRTQDARFVKPPTVFNDPFLTPEVPGITDQASMSDWDLPFPLTRPIRKKEDDGYWVNHRLTPKLFLPLARGQELFGARFGSVSSVRLSSESEASIEDVQRKLIAALRPLAKDLGWQVIPLRSQQLAAAQGTTPFDMLFLALSFFVILAALILVSLLVRLGIERRASHWGLLLSLGWPLRRVQQLLIVEGLGLAGVGGLLGVGLGILYARGVLNLLRSWWVGAVGTPFLTFFVTSRSLLIGLCAGLCMALMTIWFATRLLARQPMVQLLRGRTESPTIRGQEGTSWRGVLVIVFGIVTIVITIIGMFLNGQAAGGAFVGAGMMALAGLLIETSRRLRKGSLLTTKVLKPTTASTNSQLSKLLNSNLSLFTLAVGSIQRNPTRTALAIGLISVATLLILSMSLFEAVPDAQGTGGFQWMAESSVPIGKSLNDSTYVLETLGKQASELDGSSIIAMRVRDGDDAGCNNLYQASQPRVLGISSSIVEYDTNRRSIETFAWAGSATPIQEQERLSRWKILERDADGSIEHPFPVMIDMNTALWALHLTGGIGQKFAYTFGSAEIHFETVGLLQNTILQGSLILGEKNFNRAFPNISGYQAWLIHVPRAESIQQVSQVLETGWSDEGMDAIETDSILRNLLAVQNTYLKAFQSLGALGLLLGTFGLAVVQLRSVMERQSEFGLMRAIGFTRWRIGSLILLESAALLLAGLGIGCLASAVALLPTLVRGTIHPEFLSPLAMLGIVTFFGILASLIAVRRAMQLKLLEAIRGD